MKPVHMRGKNKRRGFVLVMMAVMAVVLIGALGISVDLGRVFVAKHEAQIYTDAAALSAAQRLNGTQAGANSAANVVNASANKWNMSTKGFSASEGSHTTTFSTSANGPWVTAGNVPASAPGYQFAKVTASVTLPLYFINIVVPLSTTPVTSVSVAGQVPQTKFYTGLFPYTPLSFSPTDPTTGFVPGTQYTIRYPSGQNATVCAGDVGVHSKDPSDRGHWGDSSASVIERRITDDFQSGSVAIAGQDVGLSGGAKTTESAYLDERSNQDPDQSSLTAAAYKSSPNHNGRRLVVMPITNYNNGIALGFASFLVMPAGNYDHTGNGAWCAIYVGSWSQNQQEGGASATAGAFLIKLVQ